MATITAYRTTVLVLALAAAPCMARGAAAQSIRVGATVTAPAGLMIAHDDSTTAAPIPGRQRVRIADVGGFDIQTGLGAVVRVASESAPAPERPRMIRVTIDFVGS